VDTRLVTLDVNASTSRQARARLDGLVRCRQFTEGGRNQQPSALRHADVPALARHDEPRSYERVEQEVSRDNYVSYDFVSRGSPRAGRFTTPRGNGTSRQRSALRPQHQRAARSPTAPTTARSSPGTLRGHAGAASTALVGPRRPSRSTTRFSRGRRPRCARAERDIGGEIVRVHRAEDHVRRLRRVRRQPRAARRALGRHVRARGVSIGSARTRPLQPGAPPAPAQPRESHAGTAYLEPTRMAPAAWMRPRAAFHGRL